MDSAHGPLFTRGERAQGRACWGMRVDDGGHASSKLLMGRDRLNFH